MLRWQLCCVRRRFRRTIVTFLLISHKPQLRPWNFIYRQKAHESSIPTIGLPNGNAVKFSHTNRKHFTVGDPMAFPIVKMENNPPSLCTTWAPSNTTMHRPTARTTPNRSSDGWGTVAHVRRNVPAGCTGAPLIRPQKYPLLWTDPQTPPPASFLDPSDLWCQTASGSDPPFFHNALDRPTNGQTHGQTDRSSTGKFDRYRPLQSEILIIIIIIDIIVVMITVWWTQAKWRQSVKRACQPGSHVTLFDCLDRQAGLSATRDCDWSEFGHVLIGRIDCHQSRLRLSCVRTQVTQLVRIKDLSK